MPYFTSWDINAFLCLVSWGLPEDVVKMMMKTLKYTHERFISDESMAYWVYNSPELVTLRPGYRNCRLQFCIDETLHFSQTRVNVWNRRNAVTKEFKREWRYRSIETRKAKVVEWCKFGEVRDQRRHQERLNRSSGEWNGESYIKNLWRTWEAWSHCENPPIIMSWDTVPPQPQERRNYISKWYEGIHPGRFFLFYKENKIIEERHRGIPKGPCTDGYVYPKTPIFDWGPFEQLIEDLKCIDGPGLGESGSKVEHIDDIFLKNH